MNYANDCTHSTTSSGDGKAWRFDRLYGWTEMVIDDPWIYWPIGRVLFTEPFYVLTKATLIEHNAIPR